MCECAELSPSWLPSSAVSALDVLAFSILVCSSEGKKAWQFSLQGQWASFERPRWPFGRGYVCRKTAPANRIKLEKKVTQEEIAQEALALPKPCSAKQDWKFRLRLFQFSGVCLWCIATRLYDFLAHVKMHLEGHSRWRFSIEKKIKTPSAFCTYNPAAYSRPRKIQLFAILQKSLKPIPSKVLTVSNKVTFSGWLFCLSPPNGNRKSSDKTLKRT